ncbi:transmembrane amino acid transporter [Cryptosporidium xiaoi]|uniref:Transmembrane amino acid transporter n=1 Tax=Cryptosporidium xiaoi TaxID=659607 RepID=A0AAV9Y3N3_9CRYT
MTDGDSFIFASKAFATMTAGCLGSGVVFLTYGMKMAGLFVGISTLIICAFVSIVTHSIYVVGSLELGAVDLSTLLMRASAYKKIGEFLSRRKSAEDNKEDLEKLNNSQNLVLTRNEVEEMRQNMKFHFKSISIICFLSMAYAVPVYFILLRSFTEDLITHAIFTFPEVKILGYLKDHYVLSAIYFLMILPFASKSKITELDFLGWFSVVSFFTLASVIVIRTTLVPYTGPMPPVTDVVNFWPSHGALSAFKMFTFGTYAFLCHCLVVPAVLNVNNCSAKRCIAVISSSFAFLCAFSLALTVSAYLYYGEAVKENITLNFSACDIFMGFSRILSCISLCVIIPLFSVSICNFIIHDIGLINYMADLAVEDAFQTIFKYRDEENGHFMLKVRDDESVSNVLTDLKTVMRARKARTIESDADANINNLKSNSGIDKSRSERLESRRFLISTVLLLTCIFLSHVAKTCTQYVELFCGYIDAFTASIYPLFIYIIIWRRNKSPFFNFAVILACCISAVGPILSSLVTTYELFVPDS